MTDFIQSGSTGAITAAMRRVANTLAMYSDGLRAALRAHDAFENYNVMSDAALAEIGITREEIAAHVMKRYIASGS
jgi:uncharacterized protein YjiS (DUF1127 family)